MGVGKSVADRLGWAGYEGMHRWIVRPLLEVSKVSIGALIHYTFHNTNQDRILATCAENGLEYVTDPTNFQPDVTIRNAIRQMLKEEEARGSGATVCIRVRPGYFAHASTARQQYNNNTTSC